MPLDLQLTELNTDSASAIDAKASAQASVDAGEAKLSDLRSKTSRNVERASKFERVRGIVVLNSEIIQHQLTLDKAVSLEREAENLSESIGAIAATERTKESCFCGDSCGGSGNPEAEHVRNLTSP